MSIQQISVIGGGAWGTALAQTCARAGRDVTLWEFDAANAEHLAEHRESRFLPGVRLEDSVAVTRDLAATGQADAILLVVPAQAMRSVLVSLASSLKDATPLVVCAKGIEHGTHKFMTEIIAEHAPKATPAILSGPSFASDVARGLPTAVTIAAAETSAMIRSVSRGLQATRKRLPVIIAECTCYPRREPNVIQRVKSTI